MIKKLRNKFILINMCFVMAILFAVSAFLAVTYYQRNARSTSFFLESELRKAVQGRSADTDFPFSEFSGAISSKEGKGGSGAQSNNGGNPDRQSSGGTGVLEVVQSVVMDTPRRQRGMFVPFVVYKVGPDGALLGASTHGLTLSDENVSALLSLIPAFRTGNDGNTTAGTTPKTADSSSKNAGNSSKTEDGKAPVTQGVLRRYDVRYAAQPAADGSLYVIFGDISGFNEGFRSFLFSLAGVLLAALLLFFALSFWLAHQALVPVQRAWDQQNRFVADASHELKTPITVILANLDILRSHKDETVHSQNRWIMNTREEAERMRELIENLLFLAKNDANALKEQMTEISLSEAAEDRVLNFEAVAFEKGVELESDIPENLKVTGSESQIKQLLTILIDNAVKYAGPEGKAEVSLREIREKNGRNAVRIRVANTGEPIPPEDLEHIFERFYRADKSRARKEGGYGLGLSIAESIVRVHGGQIVCESSKERGTVFTVTLPRA